MRYYNVRYGSTTNIVLDSMTRRNLSHIIIHYIPTYLCIRISLRIVYLSLHQQSVQILHLQFQQKSKSQTDWKTKVKIDLIYTIQRKK